MNIRTADRRVSDLDQYLIWTRLRGRNVLNRELLSSAHYGSFHSFEVLSCVPCDLWAAIISPESVPKSYPAGLSYAMLRR